MPKFLENWINGIQAWVQNNPKKAGMYGAIALALILGFIFTAPVPHVELAGEPIFSTGPSWLTNSVLTTIIVDIIILLVAFLATARMQLIPSGIQNALEGLVEYLFGLAESIAGKNVMRFFPISATIFMLVLVSNYTGLIPFVGSLGFCHPEGEAGAEHAIRLGNQLAMADGNLILLAPAAEGEAAAEVDHGNTCEHGQKLVPLFRAPSADLNMTLALGLTTMVLVQYFGVSNLGAGYFKKFWNTSGTGFMKGINIFVGILEAISEVARIISFTFRLFGNIFAGEVVLATMAFLCAYLIPLPFYFLEVLVGAVQALVFMMLSLVFFSMAVVSHGEHHEEGHAEHH